jgi:hypothetical protein
MNLKMLHLSVGLKLSNPELGYRKAAIQLLAKQIPPRDS